MRVIAGVSRSLVAVAAGSLLAIPVFAGCTASNTQRNAGEELLGAGQGCTTSGAQCEGHDFRGKDLRGVTFDSSVLNGARFDGANLDGATFVGTSLKGTSWQPPDGACRLPFSGAHAQCATDFGWATFDAPLTTVVSASYGATGAGAFAGDGGSVTAAKFSGPTGVAISDDSRTIYLADSRNRRVRAVDVGSGTITTVAGSGRVCSFDIDRCGDGNPATTGDLSEPVGLAYDGPGRRLFIADQGASLIRAVDLTDNTISTVAGNGRLGYSGDGGPADEARLAKPAGLTVADRKLYIADLGNNSVRVISLEDGTIDRLTGSPTGKPCSGTSGCGDQGPAAKAQLDSPNDVAVNSAGYVAIADTRDRSIRVVSPNGSIRSLIAGFKGDQDSEEAEDPRPSFVEFDRDGNLYVGPLKGGRLGRIPAAAVIADEQLNWSAPVASVTGLGAGSLLAVDPHNRYLMATDPASQQVRLIVSDVGPNLKNVKFVNAAIGPRYTASQPDVRSKLTGVIGQNTTFDNVDLDWATIRDSAIPPASNLTARKITASNTTFGRLERADLSYARLDSVAGLTATDTCLRNATLVGRQADWNLERSTLQGSGVSGGTVTFANLQATNAAISNTVGGKWIFDKGSLRNASFYNASATKPEITFNQTRLTNVPVRAGGTSPDQSDYPSGWAETDTTAGCRVDPYSATVNYSHDIEWGSYWGRNRNNPWMHIKAELAADDQGELRTGEFVLNTVPQRGTFITVQTEDGNKLFEVSAEANGTFDVTPQIREMRDKGTPYIVRPGSRLHFDVRNDAWLFDPEVRGHHYGQSSEFPQPQGSMPLTGVTTVRGHLDGAGLGKSTVTVKVQTDGAQRLSGVSMSSDHKDKNLEMLIVDPVTKMSAPEDFRRGSLSQLTVGQRLDLRVWSVKDPDKVLKGSMSVFDPDEPDSVDNVTATNQGNGVVKIAWAKRNGGHHDPENYVVTASPGDRRCTVAGTGDSCEISKLAPVGTEILYTFTVQANRGNYHREVGKAQLQLRDPNIPTALTDFAAGHQGGGVVKVTWKRPSDGSNPPDTYVVTAAPGGVTCTVPGTADGCELKGMTPPKGSSVTYTLTAVGNRGSSHPEVGRLELTIDSVSVADLQKERDAKIAALTAERDQKLAEVDDGSLDEVKAEVFGKTPAGRFDATGMFAEFDQLFVELQIQDGESAAAARTSVDEAYALVDRCAYPGWRTKTTKEVLSLFYLQEGVDESAGSNCKFGDLLVAALFPTLFVGEPEPGTPPATQFGRLATQLGEAVAADAEYADRQRAITNDYQTKIDAVAQEYDRRIKELKD